MLLRTGLSIEELKERKKAEERAQQKAKQAQIASSTPKGFGGQTQSTTPSPASDTGSNVRKDSSPIKVSWAILLLQFI